MGITSDYVDFCLSLDYKDLPAQVVEKTTWLGLDFVGVAAYGTLAPLSRTLFRFLEELELSGDCAVIGSAKKFPPQYAALANGTFVKPNELDDVEQTASLHPGAPVWPVAFALGEKYGLDGKRMIAAVVLGYETITRLGRALNPPEHIKRGFHPSSTCGAFAATVTASRLLGLDRQQMIDALGITGSQTSGSFRYILEGSWTKAFHSGWAAHNGILAALLARRGFNGPTDIFEGELGFLHAYSQNCRPEMILKDLGKGYLISLAGIKIHGACRQEHPIIDGVISLVGRNDLKPDDIRRVDVYMTQDSFITVVEPEETKRRPKNVGEAMHSVYFGVAMSILRRRAFIEEHSEAWLEAPEVHDLIRRIFCHHDPELDPLLPDKFPGRVVITTTDGRTLEEFVERPHGDGLAPLSWDELRGKYEPLAQSIFSAGRAQAIEEMMLGLDGVDDFTKAARLLGREGKC